MFLSYSRFVFLRYYVWNIFLKIFINDFKNFSTAKKSKSTIRNVSDIEIYGDLEEIQITIQADDFLHNMARLIIGTLLDIGHGNRKIEDIEKIFAGKAVVSEPCDPKGLFLQEIVY